MRKLSTIRASASASGESVELWITSEVTSWTAADFMMAVSYYGSASYILNIHSPGGDPFSAFAICDTIKAKGLKCTARIWGHAASAAAIIASACARVEMGELSHVMVHNAYGGGDQALLDSINEKQIQVFTTRTGMNASAVKKMMDAETWMDAKTAKANGFADAIIKEMSIAAMHNAPYMETVQTPAPVVEETPAVVPTPELEPTDTVEQEVPVTLTEAVQAAMNGKIIVKVPVAKVLTSELQARTEELKAKALEFDEVKAEAEALRGKVTTAEAKAVAAEVRATAVEAKLTEAFTRIKAMEETPLTPATTSTGDAPAVIPASAPAAKPMSDGDAEMSRKTEAMRKALAKK